MRKSAEKFWQFEKNDYLCPMEQRNWVITGRNKLSGYTEELTGPMTRQEAEERLQRERESRRNQRYMPYTNMRVEKLAPRQLTLNFEPYE